MNDATRTILELELTNGRALLCPTFESNPGGAHWIAVRDRDGEVSFRSTFEQWETDPVGEMTRFADAATGGRGWTAGLPTDPDPDSNWGPETAVTFTGTGRTARWAPAPEEIDYLRVVEPDGREVAYWSSDEWQESPKRSSVRSSAR